MQTVNIHQAKTQLSRLIAAAVRGDSFIISKAGKPLVKVTGLDAAPRARARRLGFLAGQMRVPDEFDQMGKADIEKLFSGKK